MFFFIYTLLIVEGTLPQDSASIIQKKYLKGQWSVGLTNGQEIKFLGMDVKWRFQTKIVAYMIYITYLFQRNDH